MPSVCWLRSCPRSRAVLNRTWTTQTSKIHDVATRALHSLSRENVVKTFGECTDLYAGGESRSSSILALNGTASSDELIDDDPYSSAFPQSRGTHRYPLHRGYSGSSNIAELSFKSTHHSPSGSYGLHQNVTDFLRTYDHALDEHDQKICLSALAHDNRLGDALAVIILGHSRNRHVLNHDIFLLLVEKLLCAELPTFWLWWIYARQCQANVSKTLTCYLALLIQYSKSATAWTVFVSCHANWRSVAAYHQLLKSLSSTGAGDSLSLSLNPDSTLLGRANWLIAGLREQHVLTPGSIAVIARIPIGVDAALQYLGETLVTLAKGDSCRIKGSVLSRDILKRIGAVLTSVLQQRNIIDSVRAALLHRFIDAFDVGTFDACLKAADDKTSARFQRYAIASAIDRGIVPHYFDKLAISDGHYVFDFHSYSVCMTTRTLDYILGILGPAQITDFRIISGQGKTLGSKNPPVRTEILRYFAEHPVWRLMMEDKNAGVFTIRRQSY